MGRGSSLVYDELTFAGASAPSLLWPGKKQAGLRPLFAEREEECEGCLGDVREGEVFCRLERSGWRFYLGAAG
jgi:hypothetical protein